ncbi:hypothetical protein L484_003606 [Morus notabilis]|uniref:Uncharacterized protein n=1 Tax=Morus notabilis TaxID=981085 RepID=W9RP04_9ROSA|nr:hypothetical protein L484_003606 [Morus notabilis]
MEICADVSDEHNDAAMRILRDEASVMYADHIHIPDAEAARPDPKISLDGHQAAKGYPCPIGLPVA